MQFSSTGIPQGVHVNHCTNAFIKAIFLSFFTFFSCGCSSARLHHPASSSRQRTATHQEKFGEVYWALVCRDAISQAFPADDRFYLSCEEAPVLPSPDDAPLPYPSISATVHFPPLKPNSSYFLYCPATGCPQQPELLMKIQTDDEGKPVPSQMLDGLKEHKIHCNMIFAIGLYANPGYCSDWYLLAGNPFSVLHTTFTYKPITSSLPGGQTLTISKKEPGGNILEISLTNFSPKKQLLMTSCSEGETISKTMITNKDGSCALEMAPQVIGFMRGVDHVTISWDDASLTASAEWDTSTMDIKRLQPRSGFLSTLLTMVKRHEKGTTESQRCPEGVN